MIQLKTLLEQSESDLQQSIIMQLAIFEDALRKVNATAAPEDLTTTASVILESYIKYLRLTQKTAQDNPGAAQEDVLDENKLTIIETIKSEMVY